ncbi:MAG TPA: hypothetical protein EYH01_09735 [Campylobacterales bacterium]|nr:hypothetical protein [Campylobacterales bacterium]HIP60695.1 hypothetical protein [Campylobacterales bacterium]
MELKELILSTLEELDVKIEEDGYRESLNVQAPSIVNDSDERAFLLHSKERLEVLFDGLNSDENQKAEAKLKLVINFLQFYLTQVDERLSKCPK